MPSGEVVVAHCPNPGSMLGLRDEGTTVWLEPNDDPRKKLKWGWRLAELPGGAFVGIDTGAANKIVGEALREGRVPGLSGDLRAEVPYGENSRVDFVVNGQTYVEVKSVTLMREPGLAEFPDSVTKRGAKHLEELSAVVAAGKRAVMLYLVQRTDCDRFALAADLDPAYAQAFARARQAGVEVMCFATDISPLGLRLGAQISV